MTSNDDDIIDVEIGEAERLPAVIGDAAWNAEDLDGLSERDRARVQARGYTSKPGRSADGRSTDPEAIARRTAELENNGERRCVGTNARGDQCRKWAIRGGTVCKSHGGAVKATKNKARVRIENATDRLMGKLIDFAFDDTKPPDTQLRAIRDALDRGGMKPPSEVVLSQGETKPYEMVFDGIYSGPPVGIPPDESDSGYTGYGSDGTDPLSAQGDPFGPNREPATAGDPASSFSHPPRSDQGEQATPRENTRSTGAEFDAETPYTSERSESSRDESPRRPRRREDARDAHQQRPEMHITGEDAMWAANRANQMNREISALPPLRELESKHRRYPRP